MQDAVSPLDQIPDLESYRQYSLLGFSYIENWVVNTILKRKTKNDLASITVMTVPSELPNV